MGINGGGLGVLWDANASEKTNHRSLCMDYVQTWLGHIQCSPTQSANWGAGGRGSGQKKGCKCGNGDPGLEVQHQKKDVSLNREDKHKGKSIRTGNTRGLKKIN